MFAIHLVNIPEKNIISKGYNCRRYNNIYTTLYLFIFIFISFTGSTLSHLAPLRARQDPQTWDLDLLLLPTHVMFKDIVIKISVTFVPSSHSQTCNIIYIFINIQKNTNIISRKPRTLLLSTYLKIINLDSLHPHQLLPGENVGKTPQGLAGESLRSARK